jgi:hypothetical protein
MDSAGLFPVPVDLLEVIDDENGNPDNYLHQIINSCDDKAHEVSRTIYYLKVNRIDEIKIQ